MIGKAAQNLKSVRIGSATLNQTPLDLAGNTRRILKAMADARGAGVQVLVLPELCLTGYGCEDAFFRPDLSAHAMEILVKEIAPASKSMICTVGLPVVIEGGLYNAVAVLGDGRILGINAKRRLPRDGVHYEPRWFRPWADGRSIDLDIDLELEMETFSQKIPFGDLVYDINGARIALEICEEAWGAVPAAAAAAGFADIVLNPSASHFALGKYETREHLVANSSRSFGVFYAYSNLVGLEAGRIIYDGGALIACDGKITGRGQRFSFADGDLVTSDANLDAVRSSKMRKKSFSDIHEGPGSLRIIKANIDLAPQMPVEMPVDVKMAAPRTTSPLEMSPEEEFLRASALGLFDYLRKSKSKGYALSLSGGCDSSVCAVLVAQMRHLAVAELGKKEFLRRSGLADDAMTAILLCAWQGTNQSGTKTHEAARQIAAATGGRFVELNVQPAVDFYLDEAARASGRKLDWQHDDLALQNIQARARAPMIWLLANMEERLLLTTANRSEAAVGYTTMDGDAAGGLAPLAGIDKAFLLKWAAWAAKTCTIGMGPVPALEVVLNQPPSAELRPIDAHQTDEGDLMPYAILALIEACRVRDKLGVPETVATVFKVFGGHGKSEIEGWVAKFDLMWRGSQWKRERFAPSFHLDDFSVDPKSFCRFPIFSGEG